MKIAFNLFLGVVNAVNVSVYSEKSGTHGNTNYAYLAFTLVLIIASIFSFYSAVVGIKEMVKTERR